MKFKQILSCCSHSYTQFLLFSLSFVFSSLNLFAQDSLSDTIIHQVPIKKASFKKYLDLEVRPAWVIPSGPFYKVTDPNYRLAKNSMSGHVQFGFSLPDGTYGSQVFPKTQQGIGFAYFNFGNREALGNPFVGYIYQNSELTNISKILSFHYEWNFGLSSGWKPYNRESNPNNMIVGSKENAFINLGLFLKWKLNNRLALKTGADFTHFSNGNTEYPNAGFNLSGLKLGLAYDMSQMEKHLPNEPTILPKSPFEKHISYDLVVFGSVRRKGVMFFSNQVASPNKYPVVGAYFAPMYNLGYRFRTGISLDAIYDGSANVYTEDFIVGTQQEFFLPPLNKQLALGLSARADYIMPIFTISFGLGANVLHNGGDFNGTYQSFALKTGLNKNLFLHIGYNLKDFQDPNYLMLGFGYRFNNKRPSLFSMF